MKSKEVKEVEEEVFVSDGEPEENVSDTPKMPSWAKVSREVCEQHFDRWAVAMGLESKFDQSLLNKEQIAELQSKKMTVLRAMMEGSLKVNGKGEFVFLPADVGQDRKVGEMTFSEPKLNDVNEASKIDSQVEAAAALIARMTGKDKTRILYFSNRNSSVCNAISALFLA